MYAPSFIHNNIPIHYHFLNKEEIPTGVKIEPVYEMTDSGRYADGRVAKPQRLLVAVNVWGIYECLKN